MIHPCFEVATGQGCTLDIILLTAADIWQAGFLKWGKMEEI
jgi:hypothetical protein